MPIDLDFLRQPIDFRAVLSGLRPRHWPPTAGDIQEIADHCTALIAGIYIWEGRYFDQPLRGVDGHAITTAEARRQLAREVALSQEGDTAVLLIPFDDEDTGASQRQGVVSVELRAVVDHFQGPLVHPELILVWVDADGEEHEHYVTLRAKGPQWYMVSQLRDDLREGRLAIA